MNYLFLHLKIKESFVLLKFAKRYFPSSSFQGLHNRGMGQTYRLRKEESREGAGELREDKGTGG